MKFSLEPVLQAAVRKVEKLQQELKILLQDLEEEKKKLVLLQEERLSALTMRYKYYLYQNIQKSEEKVDQKQQELTRAFQERKVIEKLKLKYYSEWEKKKRKCDAHDSPSSKHPLL